MVEIAGMPKPIVRWFHNNEQVVKTSEITIEEVEENIFTLVIKKMESKYLGPITCEAHNDLGVITTTTVLESPGQLPY